MNIVDSLPETQFYELMHAAQKGSSSALEDLIQLLEPEMKKLSWFIRMPQEDSLQTLKLLLVELIYTSSPT